MEEFFLGWITKPQYLMTSFDYTMAYIEIFGSMIIIYGGVRIIDIIINWLKRKKVNKWMR